MRYVYDWVRNVVCFYIFFTALLHLLPKSNYYKYVRFFGGLILAIMLLSPVLELMGQKDSLLDNISFQMYQQDLDSLKLDTEKLEEAQRRLFIDEYEKAIANDILTMAQGEDLQVHEVKVRLNDDYALGEIRISVSLERDDPIVERFKKKLRDLYQIDERQIVIVRN